MGHGVRAALVAMILRTLVEDLRVQATDPAKLLQELNRGISRILKHTHLSIFVSALYLTADIARGELLYANAGHPTPVWVHRERRSAEPLHGSDCGLRPRWWVFFEVSKNVGDAGRRFLA
jgi:phosphoserine phosphatase RsbU/P